MKVTIKETKRCPDCNEWLVMMSSPINYYCYNTKCKNYSRELTEKDLEDKE